MTREGGSRKSTTGLDVFDRTLQTTAIWLDEVADRIGTDRRQAWELLSAVLHALRDRLPVDLAAHLGAQLPLLVRGAYYDRFEPARPAAPCDTPDEFTAAVAAGLGDMPPADAETGIAAVFALLDRHLTEGQLAKIRGALPRGLRMAWDGADARLLADAGA